MKVEIIRDDDPMSPREWDNVGTLVCFHKRYKLGDEHRLSTSQFGSWAEMREYLEKEEGAIVVLPLYLIDHSGISMSVADFGDPWDSGQVGFIYTTASVVRAMYMRKRITKNLLARVIEGLKGEVATYDQYLTGDVWGYVITDDDGETVDSCFGFFGHDTVEEEANAALKAIEQEKRRG